MGQNVKLFFERGICPFFPKHHGYAFIFMVLACLLANATGTRDLPIKPGYKSVPSFQVSGDQAKCLNLLSGMNSCTSDIVDFFSDRLTNLGPGCCSSISTITKNCLPAHSLHLVSHQSCTTNCKNTVMQCLVLLQLLLLAQKLHLLIIRQ